MHSADPAFTGKMVALKRRDTEAYDTEYVAVDVHEVANKIRYFPAEWILPDYQGITEEAYAYLRPLIKGEPSVMMKDGLPVYCKPYYLR